MKKYAIWPIFIWPNRQNSCILWEIGVGEHDGKVRFLTGSRNVGVLRMCNKNMQFRPYLWTNRPNSCILLEIWVGEHDGDVRFLTVSLNMAVSRMRNKNMQFGFYFGQIAQILLSYMKSESGNTMVTSDFWPEVEIQPFRACAIQKYANWPLLVAESTMNSSMGRYHVPQKVFLVYSGFICDFKFVSLLSVAVSARFLSCCPVLCMYLLINMLLCSTHK